MSGGGSNCENIIRYFKDSDKVNVALVVANKTGIPALEKAERLGVPTRVLPKADLNREDVVLPLMKEYSIDFIVLAGFLLVIPDFLIHEYDHRMINASSRPSAEIRRHGHVRSSCPRGCQGGGGDRDRNDRPLGKRQG